MDTPEIQNKIKWNIILNEVYEHAKKSTTSTSKTPTSVLYNVDSIIKSENLHLTSHQLAQLNTINQTLTRKPKITRSSDTKVTITETFIKTSELDLSTYKNDGTKVVEIFASDAIIFDSDIDFTGFYGILAISAPSWIVKDQTKIKLDGKPPNDITPNKATNIDYDGDCVREKLPGVDGIPGNPGNSAGSFLGLFETVENGKSLTITASGSNGSKGQDGGDGPKGCDGADADVESFLWNCSTNFWNIRFHCKGETGYPGGNGGGGGIGGKGGLGGNFQVYSLKNSSIPFSYEAKNGSSGAPGVGGNGGQGGTEGDGRRGDHVWLFGWHWFSEGTDYEGTAVAESGTSGETGTVNKNLQEPNQPFDPESYLEEILNDYKNFIEDSLQNDFIRERNYKFLLQLMKNKNFDKYYTPKGLAQEFINLEEHFYDLNEKIDFLPLYKELLKHIRTKASSVITNEEKKVLAHLYTATLTKICALQEATNKNFIVNLETFLDICIEDINDLKTIEAAVTIDATTTTYDNQIDQEISEAKSIVNEHITPKIQKATDNINNDIKKLSAQIANLQREAEINEAALEQAKRDMQGNMFTSIFAGALNIVGDLCSFIPGVGGAIKGATTLVTTAVEFSNQESQNHVQGIIDGYQDVKDQYSSLVSYSQAEMEAKRAILSSKLLEIESQLHDPEVSEILTEVKKIHEEVDAWDGSEDGLIELFIEKLKNVEEKISEKSVRRIWSTVLELAKQAMEYAEDAATVLEDSKDLYNTIKDDQDTIDNISDMIDENRENIERIKGLRSSVQTTLAPMLGQIGDTLNAIEGNLDNESTMQLEVTNWDTTDTLNNIKAIMEEYTTGFEVQPEMTEAINIIMDSMDKMISVYEKIQGYQNQKKVADYMSLLNSAGYRDITVTDSDLQATLDKLDLYIKSNTLLQKYRQSLTQIKQYAFPLAETYFKDIGLPQAIKIEDNIEAYTENAINQIKKFKSKLSESEMYLLQFDEIKHQSQFYDSLPAGPFYIWSNQTHHDSISKLLSGEEVLFFADSTSPDKNAVKFNVIDIRLKSNTNHQQNLDKILESFQIAMTHSGNHYYNCNNKTYIVNTMSEKFIFDFKNNNDKHTDVDTVYAKIDKGNLLMSPYTTWKIKLTGKNEDFDSLKVYGEGADLQLVGEGEFYETTEDLCSKNMDQYYQLQSAKQKKEAECIKVLSSGVFDKNDPCYVNLDDKSKTFYNPLVLERKPRSIGDDIPYYTNNSPRFSSPINDFFKWVNKKIKLLHYESSSINTSNIWNPELAFNQMNSLLVLAPLLLHFTLSQEKEEKRPPVEEKLVKVEPSTKQIWLGFLEDFQKLLTMYNIKQKWLEMILEDRYEEIESVSEMATEEDLEKIESNLVVFLVDFLDDVMYDDSFIGIRTNKKFNRALKELTQKASEIRNFKYIFKMSKCNYF